MQDQTSLTEQAGVTFHIQVILKMFSGVLSRPKFIFIIIESLKLNLLLQNLSTIDALVSNGKYKSFSSPFRSIWTNSIQCYSIRWIHRCHISFYFGFNWRLLCMCFDLQCACSPIACCQSWDCSGRVLQCVVRGGWLWTCDNNIWREYWCHWFDSGLYEEHTVQISLYLKSCISEHLFVYVASNIPVFITSNMWYKFNITFTVAPSGRFKKLFKISYL